MAVESRCIYAIILLVRFWNLLCESVLCWFLSGHLYACLSVCCGAFSTRASPKPRQRDFVMRTITSSRLSYFTLICKFEGSCGYLKPAENSLEFYIGWILSIADKPRESNFLQRHIVWATGCDGYEAFILLFPFFAGTFWKWLVRRNGCKRTYCASCYGTFLHLLHGTAIL